MIEVNLLPESQRSRGKPKRGSRSKSPRLGPSLKGRNPWTAAIAVVAIVVPGALGFLWWNQRGLSAELDLRLEEATADSARLAELRLVSDSLNARRAEIQDRVALVQRLDQNRFVWPHIMDEVSRAVPQLAWLANVRQMSPLPDVGLQIQGIAANPLAITEFVRNLEASDYITDVRILGSQKQTLENGELSVQAFTLSARYAEPPGGAPRTEPIIVTTGF
jgi:Tfp pilus assembly protein PilN